VERREPDAGRSRPRRHAHSAPTRDEDARARLGLTGDRADDFLAFGLEAALPARPPAAGRIDDRSARWRPSFARKRLVRRTLAVADAIAFSTAFAIAESVEGASARDLLLFLLVVPTCLAAMAGYRLYERDRLRTDHSTADELVTLVTAVTVAAFAVQVAAWAFSWSAPSRGWLVVFWAAACAAVAIGRGGARSAIRRRGANRERALIVGAGEVGQLVARKLAQHPEYGVDLVGFVDDQPRECRSDLDKLTLLGSPDALRSIVDDQRIDRIIVAFSNDHHESTLELMRSLEAVPVRIDIVPRLFEALGPAALLDTIEGIPLVSLAGSAYDRFALGAKRAIDVVCASIGLVLTAPFFAFAAWRIRRESPGSPVFFRQVRLGKEMREITVLKFRTMRTDVNLDAHRAYIEATMQAVVPPEQNGLYKLDQTSAMTPFGRWLRKTSLDELPQLINVLRGEMSLVGPRPCLRYETQTFAPHHFLRFRVMPGMTGLWQVTARARSTFREALEMDVVYATSWSLRLDLLLLARTPLQLVRLKSTT
jgi:exopolysaccharide biosynthesis polyprenyl glycosylphosphotransferase